jgi:hypothetical protein
MCNLWMAATPAGREPDRGDGVTVYRHTVNGFTVRTHRTVRTTPAGWVYGVYDHTAAYDAAVWLNTRAGTRRRKAPHCARRRTTSSRDARR